MASYFVPLTIIVCYFIIVSATSTPENANEGCNLKTDDTDELLYRSIGSLQRWLNVKLDLNNDKNTKLITDLIAKEESINANKRKEMEQRIDKLEKMIAQLLEGMKVKDNNLNSLKDSVNELRDKLSELSNVGQRVNEVKNQMENNFNQQKSAIENVKNQISHCITDIKVSKSEHSQLWDGPGFEDEGNKGYFISGIRNHNRDGYPDDSYRRLISFRRNNVWTPLHE